jgi:uncharacterized protein (AIM24 family)
MNYEIIGGGLPAAVCKMRAGETIICEKGAMSWMTDGIQMQTKGGGFGKMLGRELSGDPMFWTHYVAKTDGQIACASCFPGRLTAVELNVSNEVIAQKSAFLASEQGVELSIHFQRKIGAGFFGGEGFIMQKLSGNGLAFV